MRELKFRGLVENISNGARQWVYYSVGSKPSPCGMIWIVEDEQFTGLHDKNGKEIYEGDIVNHGDNFPSVVKYDEKECAFRLFEDKPKYAKGYKFYPRDHEITAYTSPIEVIGTIHDPH